MYLMHFVLILYATKHLLTAEDMICATEFTAVSPIDKKDNLCCS